MVELSKEDRKYLYKLVSSFEAIEGKEDISSIDRIKFDKNNKSQKILIKKELAKTKMYNDDSDPTHKISMAQFVEPTNEGGRYKSIYIENKRNEFFKYILWPVIVSIIVSLITTLATLMSKMPLHR